MCVIEIRQTAEYKSWFEKRRDHKAQLRIVTRIWRLSHGHFGDIRPIGEGVSELRIMYGPGYRISLKQQGDAMVILLADGDKSTQRRDIKRAKKLARKLKEEPNG